MGNPPFGNETYILFPVYGVQPFFNITLTSVLAPSSQPTNSVFLSELILLEKQNSQPAVLFGWHKHGRLLV